MQTELTVATFPRLSERALVRRHWIDGVERYVIHDARTGQVHVLPPDAWRFARWADGTREVEEIARAAASPGETPDVVRALLVIGKLTALELVETGPWSGATLERLVETDGPLPRDRIEPLAGFELRCDGRGECCTFFTSVGLGARDMERARPHARSLPIFESPDHPSWTPMMGADGAVGGSMSLVDGRCVELLVDRRCGLQARGGIDAKPMGCRSFPHVYVDDGEVVRVSVTGACSCVFRSLDHAPSREEPFTWPSEISPNHIGRMPEAIPITDHVALDRSQVGAWTRLLREQTLIEDPIEMLLARAVELRDVARGHADRPEHAPLEPRELLERELAQFATRMAALSRISDQWRGRDDYARKLYARVSSAAARAADPARSSELRGHTAILRDERFHVRATLYGHGWSGPMSDALARMAAMLIVARELATTGELPSEGSHPIAMADLARRSVGG